MSRPGLDEALVAEDEKARDLFDDHDHDGSGSLDAVEVRVLLRVRAARLG